MLLEYTGGGGRRAMWRRGLMSTHYDPPGIVFESAENHDHATENPVAECRKAIGQELADRHDAIREFDANDSAASATDDESTEIDLADAGATESDGEPVEKTDVQRRIDSASYRRLQRVAGKLDGVNGNHTATEIRVALHTDVEPDRVRKAFDAVFAEDSAEPESESASSDGSATAGGDAAAATTEDT